VNGAMTQAIFWLLAFVAVTGALFVVLAREVMRMALGLGAFLLALAGFFAYFGFGFLGLAELFVYVGGVLILFLFAIMLVHRGEAGAPDLGLRDYSLPAFAAASSALLLGAMLRPMASVIGSFTPTGGPDVLARRLLGPLLPQFEIAGALLLVALVAVVVISGGEER
jgi:NADH:ubiquinone oxidoreductase subunit 6 (subunit J)